MEIVLIVLAHTPLYVWAVLALLIFIGVRRLRPRRTHLALAALAPAGFSAWSVATAAQLYFGAGQSAVLAAWPLAFVAGALSSPIRTVPRPVHVHGWVFDYSATRWPLTLYMLLFSIRYGLGIWAGFVPPMAPDLALAGLALSAFTGGRTVADFLPPLATALRARRTPVGQEA
jgi:hypothetical protein